MYNFNLNGIAGNYPDDVNYSKNFAFTTEVEVYGKKQGRPLGCPMI